LYWHIGDTTMRLASVRPRNAIGANRGLVIVDPGLGESSFESGRAGLPRASTAQSRSASPWAIAASSLSRRRLALGSGTRAMSPAASTRLMSLSARRVVNPTLSYASSATIFP
jgi:hypothetical protein